MIFKLPGYKPVRSGIICIILALLSSCATLLEDNATHFAFVMCDAAASLRSSTELESVVKYEPLGTLHEDYTIELKHSKREVRVSFFGNIDAPGGGYLVVTGKHQGGTNYYERCVFVPRDLNIRKAGTPTEIVLRKSGDRIDLVELR